MLTTWEHGWEHSEPRGDAEPERLAFTPWNTGGGFEPAGPFQESRRPAYRGSQRARGLTLR